MIEIKNLSVTYEGNIKALKNINLTIDEGCTMIVGQNGSGKSTLLQTLVGLNKFDGEIIINQIPVNKTTIKNIRQIVGLVFQNPDHQLFMSSIYDDLAFGLINQGLAQPEIKQRIETISKELSLESFINRSAHQLSGGQKRMAAIASVLIMQPDILLLDEPSSFLDPKGRRTVIQLLQSLHKPMLIATHDLDMALDIADKVILLNDGEVMSYRNKDILLDQQLLEENGLELPYRYQR
ncbi:MAG: energy-coupling factor ABC transporter ATP-binding protein [Erysipelotrichaceae bacterium]|nr:energy-coupling factor ABC transporter ATP-binding protein [Erysipelotrichaceae bacterium]